MIGSAHQISKQYAAQRKVRILRYVNAIQYNLARAFRNRIASAVIALACKA